jgi:hypothetical protein
LFVIRKVCPHHLDAKAYVLSTLVPCKQPKRPTCNAEVGFLAQRSLAHPVERRGAVVIAAVNACPSSQELLHYGLASHLNSLLEVRVEFVRWGGEWWVVA